ncbi:hypothetical protein E2320_003072 [Naja naja]|nr:hypothetical protein E2320_003072 [Naja naja]
MQSGRRGRLSIPGPSNQPQDTITASPSISGDLRLLHTIDCGDQLLCCQFNNDGTRVAAGLRTGAIKVYSVSDGSLHHILADNDTTSLGLPTTSMHFMPRGPAHNGDVLLTTYSGGKVKLWHVSTHTCIRTITEDRQTLASCFNPSGSRFLTGGAGPGIYMYDAQTWDKLQNFLASSLTSLFGALPRPPPSSISLPPLQPIVYFSIASVLTYFPPLLCPSHRRISGPHICGDALSIDKTGSQILTGSWRRHNTLQIWDAETCGKIMDIPEDFRGHSQLYTCHFLGTDYIIAGGSRNNLCRLIDRRILMVR